MVPCFYRKVLFTTDFRIVECTIANLDRRTTAPDIYKIKLFKRLVKERGGRIMSRALGNR